MPGRVILEYFIAGKNCYFVEMLDNANMLKAVSLAPGIIVPKAACCSRIWRREILWTICMEILTWSNEIRASRILKGWLLHQF